MQYRRAFVPGGTFFFTVVIADRKPLFSNPQNVITLRAALRAVRLIRPFTIDAAVILPDHLHSIWTLPPGDSDFPTRWRLIKTWFSKHCDQRRKSGYASLTRPTHSDRVGAASFWQKRYWEHLIRDETDFQRHVDYIHFNPVKHGYVKTPIDWVASSFHLLLRTGAIREIGAMICRILIA